MIDIRRCNERGHFNHGWLDTYHSFSFGDYFEPRHMGFSVLRVLNEDRVAPAGGFPMHGHRDMEIVTYVLEGALQHRDSLGNGSVIRPGDVQRMSAGTGVRHSEFNASKTDPVHLLQIWILPDREGYAPSYEQRRLEPGALDGRLHVIASSDGREGSVSLHQDASILAARLRQGQTVTHRLETGRSAYLHLASGQLSANGASLAGGDGAGFTAEKSVALIAESGAEVLMFDLPG